ncbi:hypothetical protein CCACVL1_26983 [Corchorus capsularis]|uniref:Uncharacterized protein n=1 Tax=Corchorus capsularis TaxID=210143 RepID=A0A1R3GCM2_COCAP|nr:hypothetical protein CCACVL1_26983 [Corchorus capsularis]
MEDKIFLYLWEYTELAYFALAVQFLYLKHDNHRNQNNVGEELFPNN